MTLRSRVNLRNRLEQRGAGFLALLITTALMAAAAAAGVQWTSHVIQREREKQLLWAGAQIQRALMAYAQTAPDEATRYPLELDQLLLDTRSSASRRHLRNIYPDPMTTDGRWALVRDPAGRIVGVHSRSQRRPLKRARFAAEDVRFEKAASYAQWVFGMPDAADRTQRERDTPGVDRPRVDAPRVDTNRDIPSHPNR